MERNSINGDLIRGNIDTIILSILCVGDNYGYEIMKTIYKKSGKQYELKEPSLYSSLKRLESQKLIESYWGNESQGGRRKYYQITKEGIQTYNRNLQAWRTAKDLIDKLIEVRGMEHDEC